MSRSNVLFFAWNYFFWVIFSTAGSKINQKIFVDVDAINFADAQKRGFLVILNENFVKNHLQENQFPTLFVTAIPLSRMARDDDLGRDSGDGRVSKILYPEIIQEGKLIKLDDLRERSWYYVCVEFENMNRRNETTGADCKIFRTMDKFGLPAESTLSDIRIESVGETRLNFKVTSELDFPLKLTAYLTLGGGEAKVYILKSDVTFNLTFRDLTPGTNYGRLCVIEEPTVTTYTVMGRLVRASIEKCYFDSLSTPEVKELRSAAAQPQIRSKNGFELERTKKSPTSGENSLKTFFPLIVSLVSFNLILIVEL